ncbi:STY1053 family phage-associated protein, partial [Shigella flexneri]
MAKNDAVIHVHTPFVLTLPDGSRREFVKGRHVVEEDVATHWFTRAHAEVSVGKAT